MQRGIVYLLAGHRHAVVFVVSLWSLRRHWDGPVTVVCGDDRAERFCAELRADSRLDFTAVRLCGATGRHASYVNKTRLPELSPYDETVFLDADTLVAAAIDDLWPGRDEAVLTSFSDWHSRGRRMQKRIMRWNRVAPSQVARMLEQKWPAINTGVVAYRRGAGFLTAWREMCLRKPSFICDEIAAQLIFPEHPVRIVDDRYNCSPLYGRNKDSAVVWHFHGKKHLRPAAQPLWWPAYQECCRLNLGGIRDWAPRADPRLAEFLEEVGNGR